MSSICHQNNQERGKKIKVQVMKGGKNCDQKTTRKKSLLVSTFATAPPPWGMVQITKPTIPKCKSKIIQVLILLKVLFK
jgi:hypothetical protein